MVALLGSHLQGSALEAYNIVAATASEYGLVKSRLLQWFREELDKKANTETSGFTKAVMQEGEDIPLFALRLLGLAQRAFPNNDVKKLPMVREKFLESLPEAVTTRLEDILMGLEIQRGSLIPWEQLVVMADKVYRKINGKGNKGNPQVEVVDLTQSLQMSTLTSPTQMAPQRYGNNEGLCCCQRSQVALQHQVACSPGINTSTTMNNREQAPATSAGYQPPTSHIQRGIPSREYSNTPDSYTHLRAHETPE